MLAGWSVLVRGRAELLEWDQLPDQDHRPEPWAAGSRNVYVVITAREGDGTPGAPHMTAARTHVADVIELTEGAQLLFI